jgi:hypothetical protein
MAGDGRTVIIIKRWGLLVALGFGLLGEGPRARAAGTVCVACDKEIPFTIYMMTDAVKRVKVPVCGPCVELPDRCYLCGVAVRKDFTPLPDGRTICRRDVRDVVLDEAEARQICEAVRTGLDRQFSRFLSLAETNVTVQFMDRVTLQEMFLVIGNDYTCPNALGCTETRTNEFGREFVISLLTGLFREDLMTTCVHEYAHTWVIENVSPARRKTLGKDAVEGFCELLSYLYAEAQGLATGKANILANHYTRGQVHLFIAAEKTYGLNDIVDWMKYGEDPLLLASDLSRVRRLAEPAKASTVSVSTVTSKRVESAVAPRPQLPEKLVLQGITWSPTRPTATVTGQNLEPNQEAVVNLRSGPVTVRCEEITPTSVTVRTNGAPALLKLEFK